MDKALNKYTTLASLKVKNLKRTDDENFGILRFTFFKETKGKCWPADMEGFLQRVSILAH